MAETLNPPPPPSRRKRVVIIVLCSILVVAAATAFLVSHIKPIFQPRELTMPDGTTVKIEALTFGKEHSFSTEPVRLKLWRWVPKPCQRFLGKPPVSTTIQTAPDTLVLWITRTDPLVGAVLTAQQQYVYYTTDRHGCKFRSNYWSERRIAGGLVIAVAFANFPRADQSFDYLIANRDGKTLASFNLTNPFKVAPVRWLPAELPITKTNGELVVELRRLARIYSSNPQIQMPFNPEIEIIQPVERGFWEKPLVQIFDPLGNCSPGSFCTNEHLWRLEANYFRTRGSQFRPDETWLTTKIPIPQSNSIVRLLQTNTVQGARIALVSVHGVLYGVVPGPRLRTIPDDALILTIWTQQRYGDLKVHVRARDDARRDLVTRAGSQSATALHLFGEGQQQFEIQPLEDSKALDIELIVQKPVRFEFFVDQKPKFSPNW